MLERWQEIFLRINRKKPDATRSEEIAKVIEEVVKGEIDQEDFLKVIDEMISISRTTGYDLAYVEVKYRMQKMFDTL